MKNVKVAALNCTLYRTILERHRTTFRTILEQYYTMFNNYIKLALKILQRKPFFTFISLFGISFTLMILMLVTAFLDHELGDYEPLSERDRMVFIDYLSTTLWVPDTTLVVDSNLIAGVMNYDTTYTYDENRTSMSTSDISYDLIDKNLRGIDGAEQLSIYNDGASFSIFKNGEKLDFVGLYTDAVYWNILDFTFVEGQQYTPQDVKNQAQVVVMTEESASKYFGTSNSYIGKEIELERRNYKVIGIIETPNTEVGAAWADVYVPFTNLPDYIIKGEPLDLHGSFRSLILAQSKAEVEGIQLEIKRIADNYQMPDPENYNRMEFSARSFTERYADRLLDLDTAEESERAFWIGLIVFLGLFILLPTLNLININISRIMERSAEIGVRKSFGADSATILWQFVFENVILTLIGGAIGLVMALVLIYIINDSGFLENVKLGFNATVFLYSLLICIAFGVLSGIIPAYRMSKMQIVESLKHGG